MVKKLYKNEFNSLARFLLPIGLFVLVLSVLCRISYIDHDYNTILSGIRGFTTTSYVVSVIALFVVSFIGIIARFYKNLLSHEGYFTFSIPVKVETQIKCKLVCGCVSMFYSILIFLVSILIVNVDADFLSNLCKLFNHYYSNALKVPDIIGYTIEILLIATTFIPFSLLVFYGCFAVGQQFMKNRFIGAAICFVIYYLLQQAFMIIVILISVSALDNSSISDFIFNNWNLCVHLTLIFWLIFLVAMSILFYKITVKMLRDRLNLE